MTIFKKIPGFSDYRISDEGKVISSRCQINRKSPKIMKLKIDSKGYRIIGLYKYGRQHQKRVHRLVLEIFVGPCPDNMEGCHNDNNKSNNKLSNLRWDTHKNNCKDREKNSTVSRGSSNGNAKLNEEDVIKIRELCKTNKCNYSEIANMYNVDRSIISKVVNRKTWTHV